jgi:TetR/AcrR family transcriptional regulator, transcriptional repressor for nem operon
VPRDGRPTQDRILATAERLVIDNGYAATSVDQVIAESGTSKGAFFHHFQSKRALADALVDRYVASDVAMLEAALEHARTETDDPVERALAFVRYFEDAGDEVMQEQSGCLYTSILTERQLVDTGASDPIAKAVVTWREGYAELLRDALAGSPRDVDVDAVSDHVFVTFEGAFLLARTTGDPSHMRTQLHTLRVLLEGLLRRGAAGSP